jgi:hypothetical protein
MRPTPRVRQAKALAHRAHAGQLDRAGRPYIEHVARVAAAVADDPAAEAVAWLHDCMEDAAWTEEIIRRDFPLRISLAVAAITRWPGHSADWYYARVRENALALRVKLADIADNADEGRLRMLPDKVAKSLRKKYAQARLALGGTAEVAVDPALTTPRSDWHTKTITPDGCHLQLDVSSGRERMVRHAECKCGQPVLIEFNARYSSRRDRKRVFYADSPDNLCVFRCRSCHEPVSDSVPGAEYEALPAGAPGSAGA